MNTNERETMKTYTIQFHNTDQTATIDCSSFIEAVAEATRFETIVPEWGFVKSILQK
jgi:hypothetical protein